MVEVSFYGYEMTYTEYIDFIERYYKDNIFPHVDSPTKKYIKLLIKNVKKYVNDIILHLFYSIWGAEEGAYIKMFGCIIFNEDYSYENATYYIGSYSEDIERLKDKRIGVTSSLRAVIGEIDAPAVAKELFEEYNLNGYKPAKSLRMYVECY